MFHRENQFLLTMGSSKSMSVSMIKPNGITNTSTFIQGLFMQYLHKAVINTVYLQQYLSVSLHEDLPGHLYKDISTVVSLMSSLLATLRSELLQPSLRTSLRSEYLQSSLCTSLSSESLQSSLLASQWSKCL